MLSVVIPVYRNRDGIPDLIAALGDIALQVRARHGMEMEAVFVVDGCPEASHGELAKLLPSAPFPSKLLLHARNFGSFPAIRTGLAAASGRYFGVIAADLQEPPELLLQFLDTLAGGAFDLVVGCRESRDDPFATKVAANTFWGLYKRFVIPEIPDRGVDVFGCNVAFRDRLLALEEAHSSLIGQIFWLGFRRAEVRYSRRAREHGKSAWTWRRKLRYLADSVFSFTDLPIRLLTVFGALGVAVSAVLGVAVLVARALGMIPVPGYAATALLVVFFGGLNILGLGIIGGYAWRAYENTKRRPLAIVMSAHDFKGESP